MDAHRHHNEGSLSQPTRRWQMTLLEIRRERYLQDMLLRRLQTRGDLFDRLLLVRSEDMMRRAVQQELQQLLNYLNAPQRLLPDRNTQAQYRLHFINRVKDPTFTDDPVTDEKGAPIEVAIYDSQTRSIIPPDCFLSPAKVRMTVLNAELWKSKGANWTTSEFNHSILKERDGKGPILTGGGLTFRLQNGRSTFGNIVFKDNSSWTKSGFCLGVMIEVEGEADVERVQEAVSEPFQVKDRRGKASQKPDLLKLTDKVQSIKKIGKDRASLLEKNKIKIVEDFLLSYYNDQHKLRTMLGIKSESDKGWKTMVEHAMECDNEYQAKYNVRDSGAHPQQVSVGQQENIVYSSMDQLYADAPVDSNTNLVPTQGVLHGSSFHQEQFCISSEVLGIKSESDKGWKTMLEHAMECDKEFQAKYKVWDNTNHPQQVSVDQQVNIVYPSMDQLYADAPVNSNTNLVPTQEVLHGSSFHQEQFCISSEATQMLGYLNVNMPSIPGLCYVGSGSSVPNPCEHDLIDSGFAGYENLSESVLPIGVPFPNAELACNDVRHTSQLQQAFGQALARNLSVTNGSPLVVGSISSQMNPCENNIIDQGDMSACYGQLTPICDLSSVSHMTTDSRNMSNGDSMHDMDGFGLFPLELSTDMFHMEAFISQTWQFPSGFDSGPSETFAGSMSSSVSVAVGPSSPHRKAKRKALLKWIISPAVARKRARAAPPVTQTTVLAM